MPFLRRTLPAALLACALAASPALADRAPTKSERSAIKRAATKSCSLECRFKSARVSTRNRRYAFATVIGEGISGVLLKRSSGGAFKRIGFQGGGVRECSYWRHRAPRKVVRDLQLVGLIVSTGAVRRCG